MHYITLQNLVIFDAEKDDLWLTCSLCNYKVVRILLACSMIYYIHIHIHIHYYDLL